MCRLKTLWCLLNLPCQGMCLLASESLDRDLGRLDRFGLRSHLLYCEACRRFQRQIKLLRCVMRRLPGHIENGNVLPGTNLPDKVRERIRRRQSGIGKLKVCPIDSLAVAVQNWTADRLTMILTLTRRRPLAGEVPEDVAVAVDRQGRSVAWWTTPVRLSWTNTARRRFRRFQVGSMVNENRCFAGDLPSSSMNSYFVDVPGTARPATCRRSRPRGCR